MEMLDIADSGDDWGGHIDRSLRVAWRWRCPVPASESESSALADKLSGSILSAIQQNVQIEHGASRFPAETSILARRVELLRICLNEF